MTAKTDVIIHMTKVKPDSTLASARIASFMSGAMGLQIIDEKPKKIEAYRNVFLINGPTAFCPFREQIASIGRKCDNMIWIQNDFTCAPPSQLKRVIRARKWSPKGCPRTRLPVIWGTIPEHLIVPEDRYINWNSLTFTGLHKAASNPPNGLLYYGAFRSGRNEYFYRYLNSAQYPVWVSTSVRAAKNFKELNKHVKILPPFTDLISQVGSYKMVVYMEDVYSHRHYTSPANRFYECLSAGVAQVFDENSVGTFMSEVAKSLDQFYDVSKYVVTGPKDVAKALKHWRTIAKEQRKWARDYRMELTKAVGRAYASLLKL